MAAGGLQGVFITLPVDLGCDCGAVALVLLKLVIASLICGGFLIKQKAEISINLVSHFDEWPSVLWRV